MGSRQKREAIKANALKIYAEGQSQGDCLGQQEVIEIMIQKGIINEGTQSGQYRKGVVMSMNPNDFCNNVTKTEVVKCGDINVFSHINDTLDIMRKLKIGTSVSTGKDCLVNNSYVQFGSYKQNVTSEFCVAQNNTHCSSPIVKFTPTNSTNITTTLDFGDECISLENLSFYNVTEYVHGFVTALQFNKTDNYTKCVYGSYLAESVFIIINTNGTIVNGSSPQGQYLEDVINKVEENNIPSCYSGTVTQYFNKCEKIVPSHFSNYENITSTILSNNITSNDDICYFTATYVKYDNHEAFINSYKYCNTTFSELGDVDSINFNSSSNCSGGVIHETTSIFF